MHDQYPLLHFQSISVSIVWIPNATQRHHLSFQNKSAKPNRQTWCPLRHDANLWSLLNSSVSQWSTKPGTAWMKSIAKLWQQRHIWNCHQSAWREEFGNWFDSSRTAVDLHLEFSYSCDRNLPVSVFWFRKEKMVDLRCQQGIFCVEKRSFYCYIRYQWVTKASVLSADNK